MRSKSFFQLLWLQVLITFGALTNAVSPTKTTSTHKKTLPHQLPTMMCEKGVPCFNSSISTSENIQIPAMCKSLLAFPPPDGCFPSRNLQDSQNLPKIMAYQKK